VTAAAAVRRRRPVAALAFTALAMAVGAGMLALFVGGGSGGERSGLAWVGRPYVIEARGMPHDRILSATVRNESGRPLEVEARSIRVLDDRGRPLESDGIFLGSFARGIYAASRLNGASDFERRRTGRLARLSPGRTRPLTVAWRVRPGRGPAERVVYRRGSLPIPR
jgi:hypothetical protein